MYYYTKDLFPSLFHFGVVSLNAVFNGKPYLVEKSPIVDTTIIITGDNPLEFLFNTAEYLGWDTVWLACVEIRSNTNGSISIWDKYQPNN